MNIVYKIYIFPLVLLVVRTVRVMIQSKIPSYIINIRINARNETISPKNHIMNFFEQTKYTTFTRLFRLFETCFQNKLLER